MRATLVKLRAPFPGWKLGRTRKVTDWVSPLASVPMLQLKLLLPGASTAPAAMVQVEPGALDAMLTTVTPLSPTGKVKVSAKETPSAGDGPLLRKDIT